MQVHVEAQRLPMLVTVATICAIFTRAHYSSVNIVQASVSLDRLLCLNRVVWVEKVN